MPAKKKATGSSPAKKKTSVPKPRRSADAAEGAAKAAKARAKAKATGQTKSSSMDAITRRYDTSDVRSPSGDGYVTRFATDRRTGRLASSSLYNTKTKTQKTARYK